MEVYQTENQQVEHIKVLWKKHGKSALLALVTFAAVLSGTRYYQHYTQTKTAQASEHYQQLLTAMQKHDLDIVKSEGHTLVADYQKTIYADLAAMMLAKMAIESNDFEQAKENLQLVIKNNKKSRLWHIAKIRYARILIAQENYSQALSELSGKYNGYTALFEEVKGDLFVKENKIPEAITAYKTAVANLPADVDNSWILLKLRDLGENV